MTKYALLQTQDMLIICSKSKATQTNCAIYLYLDKFRWTLVDFTIQSSYISGRGLFLVFLPVCMFLFDVGGEKGLMEKRSEGENLLWGLDFILNCFVGT